MTTALLFILTTASTGSPTLAVVATLGYVLLRPIARELLRRSARRLRLATSRA